MQIFSSSGSSLLESILSVIVTSQNTQLLRQPRRNTGEGDEQGEVNGLMSYWKNLAVVLFGCLCLFVFDMCERGVQLQVDSPF